MKNRKFTWVLLFILFGVNSVAFSQPQLPVWGKHFIYDYKIGDAAGSYVFDADTSNALYLAVCSPDSFIFDSKEYTNAVFKYDLDGKLIWTKEWSAFPKSLSINQILFVDQEHIFITGNYKGVFKIDDSHILDSLHANGDTYLICLDSSGTVRWAKGFSNMSKIDLFKGHQGQIYFQSNFLTKTPGANFTIFDSVFSSYSPPPYGEIDLDGNLKWYHSFPCEAVAFAGDSAYYIAGVIGGWFKPGQIVLDSLTIKASSTDRNDLYIAGIDVDRKVRWVKQIKYFHDDDPILLSRKMTSDEYQNVYLAFEFIDSLIVGDTTITGNNSQRFCMIKFDKEGNFKWFRQSSTMFGSESSVDVTCDKGVLFSRAKMLPHSEFQSLTFDRIAEESALIKLDTANGNAISSIVLKLAIDQFRFGSGYSYFQLAPLNRNPLLFVKGWEFKPIKNNDFVLLKVDTLTWWVNNNSFEREEIVLYPNPASKILNIKLPDASCTEIYVEIYNLLGEKLFYVEINGFNKTIDISFLQSGLYWIRINNNKRIYTSSFLKI